MREEGEQDLHLIDCVPACSIIVGGHHHKALAGTAGGQCVYISIHSFFLYSGVNAAANKPRKPCNCKNSQCLKL